MCSRQGSNLWATAAYRRPGGGRIVAVTGEDGTTHRRQRRRLRASSQDEDTDEEWSGGKPGKPVVPPIRHLSLSQQRQHSLLQQHVSSPTVRTPGGSEIRRLSSKCGSLVSYTLALSFLTVHASTGSEQSDHEMSDLRHPSERLAKLMSRSCRNRVPDTYFGVSSRIVLVLQLFFEGEDNPAVSPATSPKISPQISPAAKQEPTPTEGKGHSGIDRKVTCLKSALGFKTSVKRVRLYLQGWPPEAQKDGETCTSGRHPFRPQVCGATAIQN